MVSVCVPRTPGLAEALASSQEDHDPHHEMVEKHERESRGHQPQDAGQTRRGVPAGYQGTDRSRGGKVRDQGADVERLDEPRVLVPQPLYERSADCYQDRPSRTQKDEAVPVDDQAEVVARLDGGPFHLQELRQGSDRYGRQELDALAGIHGGMLHAEHDYGQPADDDREQVGSCSVSRVLSRQLLTWRTLQAL